MITTDGLCCEGGGDAETMPVKHASRIQRRERWVRVVLALGALTCLATAAAPTYRRGGAASAELRAGVPLHLTVTVNYAANSAAEDIQLSIAAYGKHLTAVSMTLTPQAPGISPQTVTGISSCSACERSGVEPAAWPPVFDAAAGAAPVDDGGDASDDGGDVFDDGGEVSSDSGAPADAAISGSAGTLGLDAAMPPPTDWTYEVSLPSFEPLDLRAPCASAKQRHESCVLRFRIERDAGEDPLGTMQMTATATAYRYEDDGAACSAKGDFGAQASIQVTLHE